MQSGDACCYLYQALVGLAGQVIRGKEGATTDVVSGSLLPIFADDMLQITCICLTKALVVYVVPHSVYQRAEHSWLSNRIL